METPGAERKIGGSCEICGCNDVAGHAGPCSHEVVMKHLTKEEQFSHGVRHCKDCPAPLPGDNFHCCEEIFDLKVQLAKARRERDGALTWRVEWMFGKLIMELEEAQEENKQLADLIDKSQQVAMDVMGERDAAHNRAEGTQARYIDAVLKAESARDRGVEVYHHCEWLLGAVERENNVAVQAQAERDDVIAVGEAFIEDIAQREARENALRKENERLSALLWFLELEGDWHYDCSPDGTCGQAVPGGPLCLSPKYNKDSMARLLKHWRKGD